jgi:hypothetical protein
LLAKKEESAILSLDIQQIEKMILDKTTIDSFSLKSKQCWLWGLHIGIDTQIVLATSNRIIDIFIQVQNVAIDIISVIICSIILWFVSYLIGFSTTMCGVKHKLKTNCGKKK